MDIYKKQFIEHWSNYLIDRYRISVAISVWIAAQFALESDFGRSPLFVLSNNICGMRFPLYRPSTAKAKTDKGFAVYDHIYDSVEDYIIRNMLYAVTSKSWSDVIYYKNLIKNSGYCPEIDYIQRVDNIVAQYSN